MIEVTESYGRMSPTLNETLKNMKPKENSDQQFKDKTYQECAAPRQVDTDAFALGSIADARIAERLRHVALKNGPSGKLVGSSQRRDFERHRGRVQ
jgi:hypothetical protein